MENVDKTIDAICNWIQTKLNSEDIDGVIAISGTIKALAELVSARAQTL